MKKYKNIVFDLGGVLFHFNYKKILADTFPGQPISELKVQLSAQIDNICKGTMSVPQAIDHLTGTFENQHLTHFFDEVPRRFTPIEKGIEFLKKAKGKGYKTYFLSNMYEDCFETIKHHDFLKLADGAIYSHLHQCIKPDPKIYEKLLITYNLKAEECLFIDDFHENITGAQACNIDGIVCDDHDNVEKRLIELGIL